MAWAIQICLWVENNGHTKNLGFASRGLVGPLAAVGINNFSLKLWLTHFKARYCFSKQGIVKVYTHTHIFSRLSSYKLWNPYHLQSFLLLFSQWVDYIAFRLRLINLHIHFIKDGYKYKGKLLTYSLTL